MGYDPPMSIWRRIGEALSAFAAGEGLGEMFDRLRAQPEHSIGFTIAVIALGAKMAKADGRVTSDEVAAFREVFQIPQEEEGNAARVFNLARNDVAGYDGYARQIARLFEPNSEVLEDVLDGLFHIAMADGEYHPHEDEFLQAVARIFGVGDARFRMIRARYAPEHANPYTVLGVAPADEPAVIRARWRALVRENHPDRLIARGVPEEAVKLATRRLTEINRAYEAIERDRAA